MTRDELDPLDMMWEVVNGLRHEVQQLRTWVVVGILGAAGINVAF